MKKYNGYKVITTTSKHTFVLDSEYKSISLDFSIPNFIMVLLENHDNTKEVVGVFSVTTLISILPIENKK